MAQATKEKLKTEEEQVEELTTDKAGRYKATSEEEEILNNIITRYKRMKDNTERQDAESDWDEADKEYRIHTDTLDDDDFRTNINKPISFSIIETEEQETIDRRPRPILKPREFSDVAGCDLANEVLKFSYDRGSFDYEYIQARKESRKYGTAVLYEYYREDKRTVGELEIKKDEKTGEYIEEYKNVERTDYDDCYTQYESIRMWYFDEAANHINKCRDAIRREILEIDEFRRVYGKKRGFYNIDKVISGGDTSVDSYYDVPEQVLQEAKVEVLHYFNRALDKYESVANGVVIRKGPMPFPHKEIPCAIRYCYKDPNIFYGIGIPKIVKSLNDERNTTANMRLDYQKGAIQKMFFYDDMIDLDEMDLIHRPFGGIPVNTQGRPIDQVIRWIEYGDVKPSSYREEELLIDDIRRVTGVDDRVQGLNVGGTATEAAILKESSMKRINMRESLAEIDTLVRLGKLRMKNIAVFYPIPKIERITTKNGEQKTKTTYKTINIQGKEYKINQEGGLEVEKIEKFSTIKLDSKFSKYLDIEYDVIFDAESSTPLSRPLMQGKITEMFDRLTVNPTILAQIDPKKAAKRYIEINDEDPEFWLTEKALQDEEEMKILAEMENKVMLTGVPLAPTPNATEEHTSIHINEVQKTEAQQVQQENPVIGQIIEAHIKGEAAQQGANIPMEGQEAGGRQGMGTQLPKPNMPMNEMTPNFKGGA